MNMFVERHAYFARLQREAPVHYCAESAYGPYVPHQVQGHHARRGEPRRLLVGGPLFVGGIQVEDQPKDMDRPSFIRMDPPKHTQQRKVVAPIVAPANLAIFEGTICERTGRVLDDLPRNETFDWWTVSRSRSRR